MYGSEAEWQLLCAPFIFSIISWNNCKEFILENGTNLLRTLLRVRKTYSVCLLAQFHTIATVNSIQKTTDL